jgi:hypothetical protein
MRDMGMIAGTRRVILILLDTGSKTGSKWSMDMGVNGFDSVR